MVRYEYTWYDGATDCGESLYENPVTVLVIYRKKNECHDGAVNTVGEYPD